MTQSEGKYRIMFDYGNYEGMKFQDGEYATVKDAVKEALSLNYSTPFLIVRVIDWEAQEKL